MKALTLHQPWASLIAIGAKKIETRSWSTSYRGPLAIHAAARAPDMNEHGEEGPFGEIGYAEGDRWHSLAVWTRVERMPDYAPAKVYGDWSLWTASTDVERDMPLGCIVATCDLVDVVPTECVAFPHPNGGTWPARRPVVRAHTEQERAFGDFTPGRYAWLLDNVVALDDPIPARGRQGLWEWEGAR